MSMPSHFGRYIVRSVVARTAMSSVYEAWDERIGRRVAIKAVTIGDPNDPDVRAMLTRFARGARAAGMLNHRNIVSVYDYAEQDDVAYLVMEFIDGVTLKTMLDGGRPLRGARMVSILGEVLEGLSYSHEHGVVHRDVKPANIMLPDAGEAKITDFGIARIELSDLTQAGTLMGSPAYMSPEQFLGEPVDHRTDIYSVGVILYQMLTGRRPYEGGLATIMHKALHTEPPIPSSLGSAAPAAFDPVVRRAMAKRRDDRYGSVRELAQAIRNAAAREPRAAGATIRVAPPAKTPVRTPAARLSERPRALALAWRDKPRWVVAGGAAAAAVVVIGVGIRFVTHGAATRHAAQPAALAEAMPPAGPAPPGANPLQQAATAGANGASNTASGTPATAAPGHDGTPATASSGHDGTSATAASGRDGTPARTASGSSGGTPIDAPALGGAKDADAAQPPSAGPPATLASSATSPEGAVAAALPSPASQQLAAAALSAQWPPPPDATPPRRQEPARRAADRGASPQRPAPADKGPRLQTDARPVPPPATTGPGDDQNRTDTLPPWLRQLAANVPASPKSSLPAPPPPSGDVVLPATWGAAASSPIGLLYRGSSDSGSNTHEASLEVLGVTLGSPADAAGLRQGDQILAVNGRPVTDQSVLGQLGSGKLSGQPPTIRISRHGKPETITLVASAGPR